MIRINAMAIPLLAWASLIVFTGVDPHSTLVPFCVAEVAAVFIYVVDMRRRLRR